MIMVIYDYDLRKYYFGNRIISYWNSLPDYVINSNSIGVFENTLDLFWKIQDCYYNYKSDLAGTESRSQPLLIYEFFMFS